MIVKYIIWSVDAEEVPAEEAMSFTPEDFENALVKSGNRSEVSRFLYRCDAEDYLSGFHGFIRDAENGSVIVSGCYMEACFCDETGRVYPTDGNDAELSGEKIVCRLIDERVNVRVDYFSDEPEGEHNDDYFYRAEFIPRGSLAEMLAFEKGFVNRILNKDALGEADRRNIAAVISNISHKLEESNNSALAFESFLGGEYGADWLVETSMGYAGWRLKKEAPDLTDQTIIPFRRDN